MSSSKPPTDSEPVTDRNWYEKMNAAQRNHPFGQWRKQFTRQELEIIERALKAEIQWAMKAIREDLPGPRRFDVMD